MSNQYQVTQHNKEASNPASNSENLKHMSYTSYTEECYGARVVLVACNNATATLSNTHAAREPDHVASYRSRRNRHLNRLRKHVHGFVQLCYPVAYMVAEVV